MFFIQSSSEDVVLEQWLDVDGFPEYEVSDQGRVRNKRTKKVLKPLDNKRGALMVILRRDGRGYSRVLRRIVASTFDPIGDEEDISPIHLDSDYTNCAASNLEWKPRWMAYEWTRQNKRGPSWLATVVDIATGDTWASPWHVAKELATTEDMIFSILSTTNGKGEPSGRYKGRHLRFKHQIR